MSKQQEFESKLKRLLVLSYNFLKNYDQKSEEHKIYRNKVKKIAALYKALKTELNTESPSPTKTTELGTCEVKSIAITKPTLQNKMYRSAFSSTNIFFTLTLKETDCTFTTSEVDLTYSNQSPTKGNVKILEKKGALVKASVGVSFLVDDSTYSTVTLSIDGKKSDAIVFYPLHSVDTSNATTTEKAKKNHIWWTKSMYINSEVIKNNITLLCPNLSFKGEAESPYVLMSAFEKDLTNNEYILQAANTTKDLKAQSVQELETLLKTYKDTENALNNIVERFEFKSNILIELETQYQAKGASKIFDSAYKQHLNRNKELLAVLKSKQTLLVDYAHQIKEIILLKSIPSDLVKQALNVAKIKNEQEAALDLLYEKSLALYEKKVVLESFEEWKDALDELNKGCEESQEAWDAVWKPLATAIQTFENNNTTILQNKHYKGWKHDHIVPMEAFLDNKDKTTINTIILIKFHLKAFQAVVDKTEGDGMMEFTEKENKISKKEKEHFKAEVRTEDKELIPNKFVFEEVGKPLIHDGITASDVQQGMVGDCYLMAALISLTKDNQALIRDMIEPVGDNYVVTLYQEGIPVKVEVNKELIVRKIAGYKDSVPAAQAINDIWVPIIEKAYAKLLSANDEDKGGNLLAIEGGDPSIALKILLGNKVKTPTELYLDEKGAIVSANPTTTISNPIDLSGIDNKTLASVLQSANALDYEIHVGSPNKFQGCTLNDHAIIPIDEQHFMCFNHSYALLAANATGVTLRDPHGDTNQEHEIFSDALKKEVNTLIQAVEAVEQEYSTSQQLQHSTKEALDKALKTITDNSLIKNRFNSIVAEWEKIYSRKMVFNTEQPWIPHRNTKNFINTLKEKIVALKEAILEKANHIDKDHKHSLKEGFISGQIPLKAEQNISYTTLKQFFHQITISIIQ